MSLDLTVRGDFPRQYNVISEDPADPTNEFTDNFDEYQFEIWRNKHEARFHDALSELVSKVERISHSRFLEQLEISTNDARAKLSDAGADDPSGDRLVVLVEPMKSNQWVAELARKHFDFKPSAYYRLGIKDADAFCTHINENASREEKCAFKDKTIVLFDDGSYSGQQISEHVQALLKLKKKKSLNFKKICVIVPFMTEHSKTRLEGVVRKMSAQAEVVIANSAKIATVAESVPDHAGLLSELWWSKERASEQANSRGVIWFDHKIPNGQSFIGALEKGNVINLARPCKTLFKVIPEVEVPYKKHGAEIAAPRMSKFESSSSSLGLSRGGLRSSLSFS